MPAPIIDDLLELFPHTVVYRSCTRNAGGDIVSQGAAVNIPAYVYGKTQQVKDQNGQPVKSSVTAVLGGVFDVETTGEFTLPDHFVPRKPKVLHVARPSDENGQHHETVYFE